MEITINEAIDCISKKLIDTEDLGERAGLIEAINTLVEKEKDSLPF